MTSQSAADRLLNARVLLEGAKGLLEEDLFHPMSAYEHAGEAIGDAFAAFLLATDRPIPRSLLFGSSFSVVKGYSLPSLSKLVGDGSGDAEIDTRLGVCNESFLSTLRLVVRSGGCWASEFLDYADFVASDVELAEEFVELVASRIGLC
jgi:hypothetical protein